MEKRPETDIEAEIDMEVCVVFVACVSEADKCSGNLNDRPEGQDVSDLCPLHGCVILTVYIPVFSMISYVDTEFHVGNCYNSRLL